MSEPTLPRLQQAANTLVEGSIGLSQGASVAHPSVRPESPHSAELARFARAVLQYLWEGYDLDGADIQDLGIKHGLIRKTKYDPETHADIHGVDPHPGDPWFVEQGWLEVLAQSSEPPPLDPSADDRPSEGEEG